MRLNGWMRLWIVATALWALPVALVAYETRPKEWPVYSSWAAAIVDALVQDHLEDTGESVSTIQVRDALDREFKTDQGIVRWAVEVEKAPRKESHTRLRSTLSAIRETHEGRLQALPHETRSHTINAVLIWLLPSLALFGLGVAIRWIWRGFRPPPVAKD